jgi:retinol dehydrogenase 12
MAHVLTWFASWLYSQLFITPPNPTADWSGKTVIVTGSNTGLGKEAARHFVRIGAFNVILAVRDVSKGEAAKDDIVSSLRCRPERVRVWELDLGDFDSVKRFAKRCEDELERLDAVIENAGVMTFRFKKVAGYETMITVNVISTFLLALLLLPKLKATARLFDVTPRLVVVSSEGHYLAHFPEAAIAKSSGEKIFDILSDETRSNIMERYSLSKLLEVIIVRKWAKELMGPDYPVIVNTIAPGFCRSELLRDVGLIPTLVAPILARRTDVGAGALVDAASGGRETHGQFIWDYVREPSAIVQGEAGIDLQNRVWDELKDILERLSPGISRNI